MSISKSDPRLTAYVFGELSAEEKTAFEAELASDEAGREQLAEIRATVDALRSELTAASPPALDAEKRKRIEAAAKGKPSQNRRRLLWGVGSLGAVAASLLLLSMGSMSSRSRSERALPAIAASAADRTLNYAPPPPATLELTPDAPARVEDGVLLGPGSDDEPKRAGRAPDVMGFRNSGGTALQAQSAVKAGEWDDNANYREFMRWLATTPASEAHRFDLRDRRFIVVRDAAGLGVPACRVVIEDESDRQTELWTAATGRAILFPHAEGLTGRSLTATAHCGGGAKARFSLTEADGVVDLRLSRPRSLPNERAIDVAFILDSTGSMSEEIAAVKSTIQKVAGALRDSNVLIRVGLVEFKDRGDPYVTRVFPLSTDLSRFSQQVADVNASGGGDRPESVNEALHVGVHQLAWDDAAFAKLAFLVGDAPPHLDYAQDYDYLLEARDAAHRGIQLYTVAASGMDTLGQVVWRQVAQYTGATNLFVLRGGAGPQSTGAGDPRSSCGGTQTSYTSGNLDALVLAKINGAIRSLDRDPMRIAGLDTDENAKPCSDRVIFAQ